MAKKNVCVDFDGVLFPSSQWTNYDEAIGPPIAGSEQLLRRLADKYNVWIFTTRASGYWGEEKSRLGALGVERWLERNGLLRYVKGITADKIPAVAYIDDRAIRFGTTWRVRSVSDYLAEVDRLAEGYYSTPKD